ncbi:MAG: hypothetical protein GF350_05225 [Chitinivibrionales bacterium]|nr:hypothetical protein [Chitinivibrionales bacterium]
MKKWTNYTGLKRQLREITEEETNRLEELTEKNVRIINEVVEALQNDEEVERWMEVIKSREWVKKIEGEE